MQIALVNGQRHLPQSGLEAFCQSCGHPMVAKCGEVRMHHWAHRAGKECDPWWEETDWHLGWKARFPENWRERIHVATTGEKHFADVKTSKDWVLEFQHSPIDPNERESRDNFYQKLTWVVNGLRRKRDKKQFLDSLSVFKALNSPLIGRVCVVKPSESA